MSFDVPQEEFEQAAERLLHWISDYLENSQKYPVLHRVEPGQIRAALGEACPDQGTPLEQLLDEFEKVMVPGLTHWNHPRFFAYFGISASAPGVLADFLSSALNQQAMLWRTSPAATETEQATVGWLRDLMGLPSTFDGVIYDTASVSTLHALACARDRSIPGFRTKGFQGKTPVVYCSDQTHNSIDKAIIMLGVGLEYLRKIPTDENFAMRPEALREAVRRDLKAGLTPCAVVATVGTTSTTAVDPVAAIADICEEYKLWLHVDAAYGGSTALLEECRPYFDGCDRIQSLVINPHKWLFTPFDLSVLYVADMDVLKETFSLVAEYLKTSDDQVHNLMDTGVQLGRRFRSLKLWMIMRYFGAEGLRERVRRHLQLARQFASWIDKHPDYERLAPVLMSVVCFRYRPAGATEEQVEALNFRLMEELNAEGTLFLSQTRLRGTFTLRLAIGNLRTTEAHVAEAWEQIQKLSRR